jgi:hypothetical protein
MKKRHSRNHAEFAALVLIGLAEAAEEFITLLLRWFIIALVLVGVLALIGVAQ